MKTIIKIRTTVRHDHGDPMNNETLLDILPGADPESRIEVWAGTSDAGERRLQLRFATWHERLEWVTQRRVEFGDGQAAGLRALIGMHGFDGSSTRACTIASLPVEHGNVVRLSDARARLG